MGLPPPPPPKKPKLAQLLSRQGWWPALAERCAEGQRARIRALVVARARSHTGVRTCARARKCPAHLQAPAPMHVHAVASSFAWTLPGVCAPGFNATLRKQRKIDAADRNIVYTGHF
eukprot:6211843-Pleurochrysis_carterae.AAC.5